MATNRLLQRLDVAADTTGSSNRASDRTEIEDFIARTTWESGGSDPGTLTIVAGDWVTFDTSQSGPDRVLCVVQAPGVTTHGNGATFGVALDACSLDPVEGQTLEQRIRVVTAGYAPVAKVNGSTATGDILVGPIATEAQAEPFVAGTTEGRQVGLALEAAVSGYSACWVYKTF